VAPPAFGDRSGDRGKGPTRGSVGGNRDSGPQGPGSPCSRSGLHPTTATVGQALEAWLAHLEPDRTESTIREHRRTVEEAIVPALGEIKLRALTAHMIDGWLTGQKSGITTRKSVRSPSTVRREFSVLRAGLNQAIKWGWLSVNPADRASPRRPAQSAELHAPSPEGLEALREEAQALETPGGHLLACVIGLGAFSGCRRGELVALRWTLRPGSLVMRSWSPDLAVGRDAVDQVETPWATTPSEV